MALGDAHWQPAPTSTTHTPSGLPRAPHPPLALRPRATSPYRPASQPARAAPARHPRTALRSTSCPDPTPTRSTWPACTPRSASNEHRARSRPSSGSRSSTSATSCESTPSSCGTPWSRPRPTESGSRRCSAQNNYATSLIRATRSASLRLGTASAAGPSATNSSPAISQPAQSPYGQAEELTVSHNLGSALAGTPRDSPSIPLRGIGVDPTSVHLSPGPVTDFVRFLQSANDPA